MNPQGQNVHWILSPARLPVPPSGQRLLIRYVCPNKKAEYPDSASGPFLSGKRDSNPRPRPWQGRALPTELFPHFFNRGCKNTNFFQPTGKNPKKTLPASQVFFDLIQLIQGLHRGKVINIQTQELIPDLLEHRIVKLKEAHLETFPVLSQGGNRF